LDFTGGVERIRKWGKGVAVWQTQSMNAPKGERDICLREAGPWFFGGARCFAWPVVLLISQKICTFDLVKNMHF
jgi:hypothetical protein